MFRAQMKFGFAALLGCLCLALAQAAGDDVAGAWLGNWEGGGAGGSFNITLTKSGDTLGGKVDVGQDTGDYSANFTTASLQAGKFTARYEYPPEPQAEIVLDGKIEGSKASGTWTMVQKGGNDAFASGTWSVEKK